MTAYVLVKAVDGWTQDDPMVCQTGYLVQVMDTNQLFPGSSQGPPFFCQVVITDATPEDVRVYCDEWRREIDWEFVAHNFVLDGHRLRVFVKPELVSASGLNGLTRDKVEVFLNNWGASVVSFAPNSVTFDATILNAIKSESFWGRPVNGIVFVENNYVQATGLHTVTANYSTVPEMVAMDDLQINLYIVERGGTVLNHTANTLVRFQITRDVVFDVFKLDVKHRIDSHYARRKWAFTAAAVQAALAAGGSLEVTRQQALSYLHNRLLD